MNLKEKWTKQNNSVKLLLKKLRRHDTIVVAIAVVIAMVLCGGLIYFSTPIVTANAKDELEESERQNNEKTIEKLDELSEYLDGLDKSITESSASISSIYEKDGKDRELVNEKNTEKITNTVNDKVSGLDKNLSSLHDTITNTQSSIERLKEIIEKGDQDADRERAAKYAEIEKELSNIKDQHSKAQQETKSLIEELQELLNSTNAGLSKETKDGNSLLSGDMKNYYEKLLEKLSETDSKMSEQNSASLDAFKTQLGDLNTELTDIKAQMNTSFTQISNNFTQMGTKIDDSTTALGNNINTNINTKFETLNTSVEGNLDELISSIETQNDIIDKGFKEVFQFVSSGKKRLASALLTKFVKIDEDATFKEIAEAIESIPTTIVLDKDDVPGAVEYVYHYHTDGKGTVCDEKFVPEGRQGGCYNVPVYHEHTDDCYDKVTYYGYVTGLDAHVVGETGRVENGESVHIYQCSFCGDRFEGTNKSHYELVKSLASAHARAGNGKIGTREIKTLTCKTKVGAFDGYAVDCNMLHGQVVAAKIVFKEGYEKYNHTTSLIAGGDTTGADILASHRMVPGGNVSFEGLDDSFFDLEGGFDLGKELSQEAAHSEEGAAIGDGKNSEEGTAAGGETALTDSKAATEDSAANEKNGENNNQETAKSTDAMKNPDSGKNGNDNSQDADSDNEEAGTVSPASTSGSENATTPAQDDTSESEPAMDELP